MKTGLVAFYDIRPRKQNGPILKEADKEVN